MDNGQTVTPGGKSPSVDPPFYAFLPGIFLLNYERVFSEIARLVRSHVSELAQVDFVQVHVHFEIDADKKLLPVITIDQDDVGALERQSWEQIIAGVWRGWAKKELESRLKGMGQVRQWGENEKL